MTSQINYGAITTSYPVAGEDNDSQGFRDNFTAIAAGLAIAKTELTQLQNSSVLRADLATNTTAVQNDLNGSTIANAFYNKFYGVYFNGGTQSASADINLANGPMQQFLLSGDPTLTFKGWPASGYATVRVAIQAAPGNLAVRHPTFATTAGGTIQYDAAFPIIPGTESYGIRVGGESLMSITVENQGTGYTANAYPNGIPITFSGISGSFTPTAVPTYIIKGPTVTAGGGGSGYTTGDVVAVDDYPSIRLTVTANAGAITAVTLVGSTGTMLPQLFLNSRNVTAITGSGLGGKVNLPCGIDSIQITNAGDSFLTGAPGLVINGLNSAQAQSGGVNNAYGTVEISSSQQYNVKIVEALKFGSSNNIYLRYIGEFPTL
jgi:hypothetical protein